jgi:hypothetical protein
VAVIDRRELRLAGTNGGLLDEAVDQFEKGNGGRKIAFTTTRSSLRFGVEELYTRLTQKKMCKDMFKRCPAVALAASRADNACVVAAPDTALRGPGRDVTPIGTPHCKIACTNVHAEA